MIFFIYVFVASAASVAASPALFALPGRRCMQACTVACCFAPTCPPYAMHDAGTMAHLHRRCGQWGQLLVFAHARPW